MYFSEKRAGAQEIMTIVSGSLFIGLNLADAWLTRQALSMRAFELNPIAVHFSDSLVIKGVLALVIVLALVSFGKPKLLWPLNLAMFAVVLWNSATVLLCTSYS